MVRVFFGCLFEIEYILEEIYKKVRKVDCLYIIQRYIDYDYKKKVGRLLV